jgi:hypothetical protein
METSVVKTDTKRRSSGPDYKKPADLNLGEAIAHFLDWNSKHKPYAFVKLTEVAYYAMGLRTRPRDKSDDVEFCEKKMKTARKVLLEKYGRRTISKRGLGIRATVDDLDMTKGPAALQAQRVAHASRKFSEIIDSIDVEAIPDTEEAKPFKEWVPRAKQQANRLIAPSFRAALLPPGSPDKPKDL